MRARARNSARRSEKNPKEMVRPRADCTNAFWGTRSAGVGRLALPLRLCPLKKKREFDGERIKNSTRWSAKIVRDLRKVLREFDGERMNNSTRWSPPYPKKILRKWSGPEPTVPTHFGAPTRERPPSPPFASRSKAEGCGGDRRQVFSLPKPLGLARLLNTQTPDR